ncbi:MAG: hypothetical protein KIT27_07035 [Legionellales bacterium]|nr:hypothetical protein [Legionellales bacterium]
MATNEIYLLTAGVLNILVFCGMAMFAAGLIRTCNMGSLFAKNCLGLAVTAMTFLGLGYSIIFMNHDHHAYFPDLSIIFQSQQSWHHFWDVEISDTSIATAFYHFGLALITMAIIAGATAEQLKLWSYVIFCLLFMIFVYPVLGYWLHEGGFIYQMHFIDRGNCALIFLSAAASSLSGILILGARPGRYNNPTGIKPILGGNMPIAVLGTWLVLIASFGFLGAYSILHQDTHGFFAVFINSLMASSVSSLVMAILTRIIYGSVDLSLVLNGLLIGVILISATAPSLALSDVVTISAIGSIICFFSIILLDKLKIDDPIGAIGGFGMASICSLLSASLITAPNSAHSALSWFKQFFIQLNSTMIITFWVFLTTLIIWIIINFVMGLRVCAEAEILGNDVIECSVKAYPDFINK